MSTNQKQMGYKAIASLLEKRILHGDYNFKSLPTERELAAEMGVAQKTAHRAMLVLEDRRLILRGSHHRPELSFPKNTESGSCQIGLLIARDDPGYSDKFSMPNPGAAFWEHALAVSAGSCGVSYRAIYYGHWDDPVILDTLDAYSGTLLLPARDEIPVRVRQKMLDSGRPLALCGRDWTQYSVPSLLASLPSWAGIMLDYLYDLGHRDIGVVNVERMSPTVQQLIDHVQMWQSFRSAGRIWQALDPEDLSPVERARRLAASLVKTQETAFLCVSELAAVGLSRGLSELGLRVGKDVSVAALNYRSFNMAPYFVPSITCIESSNMTPYITHVLKWMQSGGGRWEGPLLLTPWKPSIFVGESTCAVQAEISG